MDEKRPRILVVDDEEAIRQFLNVTLTSQGYEIIEAASGQEAISSVSSQQPDLIILDLGLPDIDGVEVTRRLRQWTRFQSLFSQSEVLRMTRSQLWMPGLMIT